MEYINFIAKHTFEAIARRHHLSMEEVVLRLQNNIQHDIHHSDEAISNSWRQIPCQGKEPTPEELFDYLVDQHGGWNEGNALWISMELGEMVLEEDET